MTKRRTQDSDYLIDSEDDLIGLTSAFAPVKGPQSVDYDEGDDAIGLTQAFEPVADQDEPRAWDEAGKWKDFDWNASYGDSAADGADDRQAAEAVDKPAAVAPMASSGSATVNPASTGSVPAVAAAATATASGSAPSGKKSGRGRHAAPDVEMSPRMQQSRKTRRVLIVVIVLLVIAVCAMCFFMFRMFTTSQHDATQHAQEQTTSSAESVVAASDNAGDAHAKLTDVPKLTSLLGMTADQAVENMARGAVVTANRAVNEEGNPIKTSLNVALTEEPVDPKTGNPTVYLGLDEEGKIIQVGYSASASALGFGSLSFTDAVNNEHVVEKTLAKIGVDVPEGSAKLPDDKSVYSTYDSDGTTVVRERCSFEGDTDVNGTPCTWSSVLSYDYTTQIVTGDLSDTVRVIYAYVTKK